jgi:hypothetical protein
MKKLVFVPIIAFLLCACEESTDPTTPSTGTITGTVKLNKAENNDYSGVLVILDNPSYSATSHTDGSWELTDVPAGVYRVDFNKLGYFTQTIYNFQFVGSGTYYFYTLTLPKVPSERVTQLDVQVIDTNSIYFSGLISPPVQSQQNVILLLSTSPLSRTIPIEAYEIMAFGASAGQYEYGMYYWPEWNTEISRGDTLYAVAFLGDEQITGVSYYPITGGYIFNTPGVYLSNVVSVVVP